MQTCHTASADSPVAEFYLDTLLRLKAAGVPFMVGGAFAFTRYASMHRDTKDLDLFVRPDDAAPVLGLMRSAGYRTELTFPHWLGKIHAGENFVDIIFSSGNGVARVDDRWFEHAVAGEVLGETVKLCPPEEMIWSKAFIQERERFDGADVLHLFYTLGASLALAAHPRTIWRRLAGALRPPRALRLRVPRSSRHHSGMGCTGSDVALCVGTRGAVAHVPGHAAFT